MKFLTKTAALILIATSALTLPAQAAEKTELFSCKNGAFLLEAAAGPMAAGLADGVTTRLFTVTDTAKEMNPLVSTSVAGQVAVFVAKAAMTGAVVAAEDSKLIDRVSRDALLTVSTALWGGVSLNNLAFVLGAYNPVAVAVGVIGGVVLAYLESERLSELRLREYDECERQEKLSR